MDRDLRLKIYRWHKWSGLIISINMMILCVTGMILVFHEELESLSQQEVLPTASDVDPEVQFNLHAITEQALENYPDGKWVNFDALTEEEGVHRLGLMDGESYISLQIHPQSGEYIIPEDKRESWVHWFLELHVDLFLELPGQIFVGLIGLIFLFCMGTGALVYGPFMKGRNFGQVRWNKRLQFTFADLHKLFGVASLGFGVLVAVSGVLLSLSFIPTQLYAKSQLDEIVKEITLPEATPQDQWAELDTVLAAARRDLPSHNPYRISYPGGVQGEGLFIAFGWGRGKFGKYIPEVSAHHALTGETIRVLELPLILQIISASGPFHFGNFGGLPVKILYLILSTGLLFISGSGIYIFAKKQPTKSRA